MNHTRTPLLTVVWYVLLCTVTDALAADLGQETRHSFRITLASQANMEIRGRKQEIQADTELCYTWHQDGRERTLSLDSLALQVRKDGKEQTRTSMSRASFAGTQQGKPVEVPLEKAPDKLKQMLLGSFGVPLCKLEVDETGREIKRTILAAPGAKLAVDNGMIANTKVCHPPFSQNEEWQAEVVVSMGNGGYAKGQLNYQRVAGDARKQTVKVSGVLSNDSAEQPGGVIVKDARYVVNGEQIYDLTQREWISGKLTFDTSFQMFAGEDVIGTVKGTIVVTLQELPAKD